MGIKKTVIVGIFASLALALAMGYYFYSPAFNPDCELSTSGLPSLRSISLECSKPNLGLAVLEGFGVFIIAIVWIGLGMLTYIFLGRIFHSKRY